MIKEKITILIKELTGKDFIDENESLINQGLLDSFSVMILVSKIETDISGREWDICIISRLIPILTSSI